ncbi:MAG: hypothetical protein EXR72_10550 [Myxococcales bacterium]|nr:hypothetical protein [Myxococcales bacterium]
MRLLKAADKGDAARLFDALDTPTQWSIESVHAAQREMRRLVADTYPADVRDPALGRLPAASEESESQPRRYFRRLDGSAERVADIKQRMYAGTGQPVGSVRRKDGTSDVWREGGSVFRFARDPQGRWGFSEYRNEWEQAKLRATHDVETVRANAALYRGRAGTPR